MSKRKKETGRECDSGNDVTSTFPKMLPILFGFSVTSFSPGFCVVIFQV